jgi:hypothetical protein
MNIVAFMYIYAKMLHNCSKIDIAEWDFFRNGESLIPPEKQIEKSSLKTSKLELLFLECQIFNFKFSTNHFRICIIDFKPMTNS